MRVQGRVTNIKKTKVYNLNGQKAQNFTELYIDNGDYIFWADDYDIDKFSIGCAIDVSVSFESFSTSNGGIYVIKKIYSVHVF